MSKLVAATAIVLLLDATAALFVLRRESALPSHPVATEPYARGLPPSGFRDIAFDSPILSVRDLERTALNGCPHIKELVSLPRQDVPHSIKCAHIYWPADKIDDYTQKVNAPPFFGFPVAEQLLVYSHKRFYSGVVWIDGDDYPARIKQALTEQYGPATFANEALFMYRWVWRNSPVSVFLSYDPGLQRANLSMGRTY